MSQDHRHLSWQDVDAACDYIARMHPRTERILAVARGGLVPAAIIAHKLNIKRIASVQCMSYTDQQRGQLVLVGDLPSHMNSATTLVVDDIWDTGKTLALVSEAYPRACRAVLVAKQQPYRAQPERLTAAQHDTTPDWVVFPWESNP